MKLSFEHISKLYGDTAALQQISKQSQTKSFCSGKVLFSKCKSLLRCWSS